MAAAGAATALVLTSKGEVVVLAVLLAVLAGSPVAGAASGFALVAAAARWGTTELGAIAGAQTVLGPALVVAPGPAAVGAGCAAAALILAVPRWGGRGKPGATTAALLAALPFGGAAAVVAAGPGPGGAFLLRAGATVAAVLAACAVVHLPAPRARAVAALLVGLAAVGLTVGAHL